MKFETISGSVYEVDLEQKRCRRLIGTKNPQPRQGPDGQWKSFEAILGPEVGENCIFFWDPEVTPPSVPGTMPATMTSIVVSVDAPAN